MFADFARLRRGVLISTATALLLPVAFGGLLAGANAFAQADDPGFAMVQNSTTTAKPVPKKHRTLSSLGRASAVAWISAGHLGH